MSLKGKFHGEKELSGLYWNLKDLINFIVIVSVS